MIGLYKQYIFNKEGVLFYIYKNILIGYGSVKVGFLENEKYCSFKDLLFIDFSFLLVILYLNIIIIYFI